MNSQEYWKRREMEQRKHNIRNEKEYQKRIQEIYQNMIDEIEKEINGFYGKYAKKEGITISEAKKRASKLDIEAYSRKAVKYVKEKNFSDQANEEMRIYNMTMKVNRLELLKANIGLEMVSGFDELQKYYDEILTDRTLREFERQAGILGETVIDNKKMAHAIVSASFHNATYSDRIWMYQDLLKSELSGLLQTGLIRGQNPRKLATHLRKRFGVSQSNAERLMITELARVQTEAQKQSVEANGYDEFQFHALGSACDQCKELNGKHFPVTKLVIAKNAPPMHPRCRCSISAYMDRQEFDEWLDFLDKGGTTEEWNKLKNERSFATIHLTDDERYALNEYKSFRGFVINERLRKVGKDKLPKEDKAIVNYLDSFLRKMPKYEGNLSRSLFFEDDKELNKFLGEHKIGKTVSYAAYTSTRKKAGLHNEKGQVQIFIINSKCGRDVSVYGAEEYEVLYERNQSFQVINVMLVDGKWNILLEEAK